MEDIVKPIVNPSAKYKKSITILPIILIPNKKIKIIPRILFFKLINIRVKLFYRL